MSYDNNCGCSVGRHLHIRENQIFEENEDKIQKSIKYQHFMTIQSILIFNFASISIIMCDKKALQGPFLTIFKVF